MNDLGILALIAFEIGAICLWMREKVLRHRAERCAKLAIDALTEAQETLQPVVDDAERFQRAAREWV